MGVLKGNFMDVFSRFGSHRGSELLKSDPLSTQQFWLCEDVYWMTQALKIAEQGAIKGEVPVGAVIVHKGRVLGVGYNQPISGHDPTCHAEIVALRQACTALQNYRLPTGSTMYVTLETCTMCFGALIHARLSRLIFATREPRAGMLGSQLDLSSLDFYNHHMTVSGGLMAEQSAQMLKQFFKQRRDAKKRANNV